MTPSCICPRHPFYDRGDGDDRYAIMADCPLHGIQHRAPLFFFPLGIIDVRPNGSGLDVMLACGCVIFYFMGWPQACARCWEHTSQHIFGGGIAVGHPVHRN